MLIDVIAPETDAARRAAESGTPATREPYSPCTVLADRHGREWTVTSYGTSAYIVGAMPPFEAMEVGRLDKLHGPTVVKTASLGHQMLHPNGLPGCHNCPPMTCHCGDESCTDYEAHRFCEAGSDSYWLRKPMAA